MRKPGYVRLGNKRAGAPGKPDAGETAVDIDRRNPVLGKPIRAPRNGAAGTSVWASLLPGSRPTRGLNRPLAEPFPVSALRVTVADAASIRRQTRACPLETHDGAAEMGQTSAQQARDQGAERPAMDPRDQARRLSHDGADRRWRGSTADAIRARLDRQISFDCSRAREGQGQVRLSRRRALRHSPRRRHLVRTYAAGVRQPRRRAHLFRV
jgi:hypothetical protein